MEEWRSGSQDTDAVVMPTSTTTLPQQTTTSPTSIASRPLDFLCSSLHLLNITNNHHSNITLTSQQHQQLIPHTHRNKEGSGLHCCQRRNFPPPVLSTPSFKTLPCPSSSISSQGNPLSATTHAGYFPTVREVESGSTASSKAGSTPAAGTSHFIPLGAVV